MIRGKTDREVQSRSRLKTSALLFRLLSKLKMPSLVFMFGQRREVVSVTPMMTLGAALAEACSRVSRPATDFALFNGKAVVVRRFTIVIICV